MSFLLFDLISVLDMVLKVLQNYSVFRRRIKEIKIFERINAAQLCGVVLLCCWI